MASQQQRRENVTQEREIHVEKDIVPKLTNRFEELTHAAEVAPVTTTTTAGAPHTPADKGSTVVVVGSVGQTGGRGRAAGKQETTESGKVEKGTHFESISDKVGGLEFGGGTTERRRGTEECIKRDREKEAYEQAARETRRGEAKGRETASQQQKQKKGGGGGERRERETGGGTHNSVGKFDQVGRGEAQGGQREEKGGQQHQQEKNQTPSLEEISRCRQTAQQNSMEAIRAAEERYAKAKEKTSGAMQEAKQSAKHGVGAATTKASELGSQAQEKACQGVGATTQYLSEKTIPVKETATEKAQQAKQVATEKAQQAKQALSSAGQKSMEYTKQTAGQAKDTTMSTTMSTTKGVAGYVGEKAVATKDVALETGKTAAEYAGKVAEEVKEQAVVAGWGAAHYTTEIAVEATKMAGGVVGKAKDVVASAAHKATELGEKPVVMARDTAVDTGERVADYTARKKTEAQRCKEEKHSHNYQVEGGAKQQSGEGITEKVREGMETVKKKGMNVMEGTMMDEGGETGKEKGGGMLGAIGETIVEIAQHTTKLVAGPGAKVQAEEEHREI